MLTWMLLDSDHSIVRFDEFATYFANKIAQIHSELDADNDT